MELISTQLSGLQLPSKPFLTNGFNHQRRRNLSRVIKARGKDDNIHRGGRLVDENMIVLRMRIKKMKMLESGHDDDRVEPPSNWMGWEKEYYTTSYNVDIVEGIGLLQMCLMNTRPSVALGMVAVLGLSLPISTTFVLVEAVGFVQSLVSVLHS